MFNRILNLKRDKKGVLSLEVAIGMFILIILVTFILDLVVISNKFYVTSQANNFLSRTVGVQGGLLHSVPEGFPGEDSAYVTKTEMEEFIRRTLRNAGISEEQYRVGIFNADDQLILGFNGNGDIVSGDARFEYGESITTNIDIKYAWVNFSNFLPTTLEGDMRTVRESISEFKYRIGD